MSTFALKMIAFITMLIDHIAACLFTVVKVAPLHGATYSFYLFLRFIGRIAFPIFCFLLVEGVRHTKCHWRYALRLAIFAVLSEVPFDLALFGEVVTWKHQSVMLTLLLGMLPLWFLWWSLKWKGFRRYVGIAVYFGLVAGLAYVAGKINTDYGMAGVVQIGVMGLLLLPWDEWLPGLGTNRAFRCLIVAAAIFACCLVSRNQFELYALISLPFIGFYNGTRGFKTRWSKWGSYFFYAAHLTLLALIFVVPKLYL